MAKFTVELVWTQTRNTQVEVEADDVEAAELKAKLLVEDSDGNVVSDPPGIEWDLDQDSVEAAGVEQ